MSRRLPFIPQLDTFRFFAVVLVIASHWLPGVQYFKWGATIGVTFFFVLSGYLISSNLFYLKCAIDERKITLPFAFLQFYFRRTLRIFPLYYLVIVVLYLLIPQVFEGNFVWYATYMANFVIYKSGTWPYILSHFWSLAVEEQFYLIWPMLIFFVNWRWMKNLFATLILCSIAYKVVASFLNIPFFTILPWSQFDAFGIGAILAYLPFSKYRDLLNRTIPYGAILTGSAVLSLAVLRFPYFTALFNLFLSTGAILLIQRAKYGFKGVTGWVLDLPVFQYLGKISYGLYVYHNFMPLLWRCLTGQETRYPMPFVLFTSPRMSSPLVNLIAAGILLIAISSLSWFLFEKPINSLKNTWRVKPRPVLEA